MYVIQRAMYSSYASIRVRLSELVLVSEQQQVFGVEQGLDFLLRVESDERYRY